MLVLGLGSKRLCQYDAVGNRTTMALVGTGTFSYDYDAVDRLKTMVTPAGERYTQQYDADSRRTTLLLGLGSKREYRYDSVGRITTQIEYNASNQGIYTMVDSYDAVGNRVKRVANGNPTTWLYDDAHRLIGQQKSGQAATFAYDANSNLTTKWHQGGNPQTMQYDAADRLTTMQSGGTTGTMSWFSRGALRNQYETGAIKATYSYTDINNNLRVAQDAAGLTTSTYDGDNLRRKIVAGSSTTTFVWDGADYLQIKPSSGDATLLVVLEGEVVGHVKGSEKRDYIVDHLGSVVAYLNSSQTLTDQFEYWPYGETIAEVEAGTEPFLWVGSLGYFRENDLRTYIRAREYRQDLGSWMQLDPLWPAGSGFGYPSKNHLMLSRSRPSSPLEQVDGSSPKDIVPIYGFKDDLLFRYGNYCGQKNIDFRNCRSEPIDCLDAACQEHDDCLASCGGTTRSYFSLCGAKCNCLLAYRSLACRNGGCFIWHNVQDGHLHGVARCLEASNAVNTVFDGICLVTGVSGIGLSVIDGLNELSDGLGRIMPSAQQWQDYLLR